MIYRLKYKIFGTKKISDLSQIETENPIRDICYVDNFGIVFSTGHCLGLIKEDGSCIFPWKSRKVEKPEETEETEDYEFVEDEDINRPFFGELSSVTYDSKSKQVFLGENGGRNVQEIDLERNYTYPLFEMQSASFIERLLKNVRNDAFVYVAPVCRERFYIMPPDLSKCFFYNNAEIDHVVGDGKYRFSIGSDAVNSSIGYPSGILFVDNKLYISDGINNVVRVIDHGSISVYCGRPKTKMLNNPSKMVVSKNIMFIMCKDSIRTCIFSRKVLNEKPFYESKSIVYITANKDGALYILEEQYAECS